jgi:hypothetical protein
MSEIIFKKRSIEFSGSGWILIGFVICFIAGFTLGAWLM